MTVERPAGLSGIERRRRQLLAGDRAFDIRGMARGVEIHGRIANGFAALRPSREQASGLPGIDHRDRRIVEVSHVSCRDRGVLSERNTGDPNVIALP
jgi:hypothetical protein